MKVSAATTFLLAAALGASAHPSGHVHMHRSMDKRTNFVMTNKPTVPEPAKVEAPKEEPKVSAKEETNNASSGSGQVKPFCNGNTKRVTKRATLEEIAYQGNVGVEGNYACNLMMVDNDVADQYKYTTTFDNVAGNDQKCVCWLKIGPKGLIDGFFKNNQALEFDLPAGSKKVLAADENTQGGCTCGNGGIPYTTNDQFAGTWYEFDFGNESNEGHSGADASSIVSAATGVDIPGMNVCGHDICSTIYPGGKGVNAFVGGTEFEDGIGLNLEPGEVRINVAVGYSG